MENRAGAAGVVGSGAVARAEPDGHTPLGAVSARVAKRPTTARLLYEPVRDFAPVASLTRNGMVLAAGAAQPFAASQRMVQHARRGPGPGGTGSNEALGAFLGQKLARSPADRRTTSSPATCRWAGPAPRASRRTRPPAASGSWPRRAPRGRPSPRGADLGRSGCSRDCASRLGGGARPRRSAKGHAERLHALLRPAFADLNLRRRLGTLGIEPDLREAEALREEMRREDAHWVAAARAGTLETQG